MVCSGNDNVNTIDISVISKKNNTDDREEKIYEYEEAINLTGNGWYNRGLLTALSIGLLGMGIDIFGFSVIVTGCSCDFNLELCQKSTMLSMPFVVSGYFILQMTFAADLVFVEFTPWRLLTIIMAAPLEISALLLHFFYESPKFLVNAGREREAMIYLEKMWLKNGGKNNEYPVKRVTLKEEAKVRLVDSEKANLNNSLIMWMPYIVEAFTAGVSSEALSGSLCSIIMRISNVTASSDDVIVCSSLIQSRTLLSGVVHGVVFAGITLAVSKFASRKKAILIAFLLIPMVSSLAAVFNKNNIASLLLYVGMTMTNLCMGVLFAYYVELFPTSYRGMAACLGVMVARISGLGGVNFLGVFLSTNCSMTFYAFSSYLLCGIIVAAYFLPSDKPKKV
ncbi:unnamed protein product [Spodoptera exigua]|nr:unnamed protein product [Spodoptera exigua]